MATVEHGDRRRLERKSKLAKFGKFLCLQLKHVCGRTIRKYSCGGGTDEFRIARAAQRGYRHRSLKFVMVLAASLEVLRLQTVALEHIDQTFHVGNWEKNKPEGKANWEIIEIVND